VAFLSNSYKKTIFYVSIASLLPALIGILGYLILGLSGVNVGSGIPLGFALMPTTLLAPIIVIYCELRDIYEIISKKS
jgi:hypothetical protein